MSSAVNVSVVRMSSSTLENPSRSHEDDLPLSEWVQRIDSVNFASCDQDGFSSVDDDILTTGTLTIMTEVKNQ